MPDVSTTTGGALVGRDRNGQALAVVHHQHLTPNQRADLATIYRLLAAIIQPTDHNAEHEIADLYEREDNR